MIICAFTTALLHLTNKSDFRRRNEPTDATLTPGPKKIDRLGDEGLPAISYMIRTHIAHATHVENMRSAAGSSLTCFALVVLGTYTHKTHINRMFDASLLRLTYDR